MDKKAVLVVSFGTSYQKTRKQTIEAIEADIRSAFPEHTFRGAFTSPTIRHILRERDGIEVDDVETALRRLAAEGFTHVLVQLTHVIRGFEYDRMMKTIRRFEDSFEVFACGEPLLTDETDYRRVVEVMMEEFADRRNAETDIILMGHGTEHVANFSYERLQRCFYDAGCADILIGTVEASPTCKNMLEIEKTRGRQRIVLAPFLVVAGDHACNDMAGEGEDSWKSRFIRDGYDVTCVLKGLGEYAGIRDIYVSHAKSAWEKGLTGTRAQADLGVESAGRVKLSEAGELPQKEELVAEDRTFNCDREWRDPMTLVRKCESGILCGIGVGPGDPELLTLKAVRTIRECDMIMTPGEDYHSSIAWQIALRALPEIERKECIGVPFPMTRDPQVRERSHQKAADLVCQYLDAGKSVGFLNLGDVTVYASYLYVHQIVASRGYETRLVNSVPSFCAAAAALNLGLAEGAEQIHILSQPEQIREGLKLSGTKIIMKMGKNIGEVQRLLAESGQRVWMVENCGMPGERICEGTDQLDESAGYYTILIVKE
ncbi:MAG: precorrin-2 C(20)-methyltransferase [Clostridiales bacterium]|nr:precorrin-2 C(20)-methyltransferase [Clostridiales bacterium]